MTCVSCETDYMARQSIVLVYRRERGNAYPNHTGNLGPSEVGTLEAVDKRDSGLLGDFQLVVVDHHRALFPGVFLGETRLATGKLHDGTFGICESALADQPPRRFGREHDSDEDGDRPDPLEGPDEESASHRS